MVQCPVCNFFVLMDIVFTYHKISTFRGPKGKKPFENIVGKVQMLVTSILSFSHNAFYLTEGKLHHLCYNEIVICKYFLIVTTQSIFLTAPRKRPFENTVGKEVNDGNLHFLLFPTKFSTHP